MSGFITKGLYFLVMIYVGWRIIGFYTDYYHQIDSINLQ